MNRKKINSPRVNLVISVVFHTVVIGALFFFAGREGMLGKRLKEITVSIAPKEKKPEAPKPKPAEPKVEPPKLAESSRPNTPPPVQNANVPPPTVEAPPAVAPPSVALPAFAFYDGAKEVKTVSDPSEIYKAIIEHSVHSHWNRPEDVHDENYVANVQMTLDSNGRVAQWQLVKGSGDKRWDASVREAMQETKAISRPPPKGFPTTFTVRFDVEAEAANRTVELSSK